ncbi:AAA family ATPase [Streptosporangiaceae bacterium NEAU-GS5]|nr:AAA family ATPase [Streptosporangiaceae bacterium NEAU-GS5]
MPAGRSSTPLFGRELEARRLGDLVAGGGALVVRGEPGIGKSALLSEAGRVAVASGVRVLTTTGVESETRLAFAGLHQMLRPLLADVGELPGPQRDALRAALGVSDAVVPELFLVALAVLNLLGEAAGRTPVLLVVEDAHWLDHSSADVLAFVARRLESETITLLAAVRDGVPSSFDAGLPELVLEPLSEVAAIGLLDAHAPGLAPTARARILAEAAGNPLALVELSSAWGRLPDDGAMLPAWLPLTTRLEQAFTARVSGLPPLTRTLLLVAALNDGFALAETLAAAAIVAGESVTVQDLLPAMEVGLVDPDGRELRFRHPLMRSAIHQNAGLSQRHAAHAALARVLIGEPDRGVWHHAASTFEPDETIAGELEAAASRAQRRGAVVAAIAALEQAARLSEDPVRRTERLLQAAEGGVELGREDLVSRLLREVERRELGPAQRARVMWIRESFDDGIRDDTAGALKLAEMAERAAADGDTDFALKLLWGAARRCFWAEPALQARRRVVTVAESLAVDEFDARLLAILAYAAPADRGAVVIDRMRHLSAQMPGDAHQTRLLGTAALLVGAFDLAERFSAASLADLRAQGRLGVLALSLGAQAWSAVRLVDLGVAIPAVEEATRLARETAQPLMHAIALASGAMLAALRGNHDGVRSLAEQAERASASVGARPILATVQYARGLDALGRGHYDDAFDHLWRMHVAADPAYHSTLRCYAVGELADAAVHSGRAAAIGAVVAEMEALALITPSPALHADLRYIRAVLADDGKAEPLFEAALGAADMGRWPFVRARAQLAYGEWLRRRRRTAESRAPLRAARDTFDALGAIPWGERARQELRASGETSRRRDSVALDVLTAQELQIAQLAADGLTNREIGQRLYLSHRTVSSHLYRLFPKLRVTSRVELGAALRTPPEGA